MPSERRRPWCCKRAGTGPLVPSEPYAASARIVSAASAGGVLYLIGGRAGGAHGNTRWTVWDGTVAGPVTSRPQEFFTFGGQDAGPLLGTVIVDGRPIIVGSRGGKPAPRQRCTPSTARSGTRSTPCRSAVGERAGARPHRRDVGRLHDRHRRGQRPGDGCWRRTDTGAVRRHRGRRMAPDRPPRTDGSARSPSRHRGRLRRRDVLGRRLGEEPDRVGGVARRWVVGPTTAFMGDVAGADDPSALLTIVDGRPLVVTNASTPSAAVRCSGGWTRVRAPAQATAIAALGSDAYLVAGDRLWRATVPAC